MLGRIRFISVIIVLVALVITFRLYQIQVVNSKTFKTEAERQNINESTILYDRETIYFENKNGEKIPAAISRSGFTIAINPEIIKNPEEIYNELNQILVLDKSEFMTKARKQDDPYEEIAKHLNSDTAEKIKNLNLYGVTLSIDKWRFYPGGKLAANVIGLVGFKDDELAGRYGLERYYEDILKIDSSKAYNNFFAEFLSNVKDTFSDHPKKEGSIITSIEPAVQLFLEDELVKTREKWGSNSAGGIIINPINGEIIAMAWDPSFDLNNFQESNVNFFGNFLVEGVYEMGSIIKPITIAAGIDNGTITANSTYYDAGFLVLNNKRISNYDNRGRGTVDMQEVLNQSLNTGAAFVALKMGNEKFIEYMKNFGIGTETGIDLPNETRGLIKNFDSGREIEIATAAYGHGIAITPIETVRALSVLANGGKLITPHIVKKIEYQDGLSQKTSFAPSKQIIKKETSEEITRMLVKVVDTSLKNGQMRIPGYSVAAKTGTAQMTNEGEIGYVEGKYLHSFFGYFPAYNPRFLIFLFHINPQNVRYASETLTDPFFDITKFIINYYQISPDRPEDVI
ncbi:MAG: penicillin-binding protein 2 [Candidatus Zambryskibacteria bacterium]|nr:penicillin-binding protein 2 [Candidatus Zambryskibacteria bacterium]